MNELDEIRSILSDEQENAEETWDELRRRITVLSDRAWEGRVNWPLVERWLENFTGDSGLEEDVEKVHALYILSQFLYFGSTEIRILLKSLFRDLFLIPLIQEIRQTLAGSRDARRLNAHIQNEMARTRFCGIGNPSESGVHLLYYFRQENGLSKHNFLDAAQIMGRTTNDKGESARKIRFPDIKRYIFVDDVCGSGETAITYSNDFLSEVLAENSAVQIHYHSMFATSDGIKKVRKESAFGDNARAVYELDDTYKCLSNTSRYLKVAPKGIDPQTVRRIANHYGNLLAPGHGGGYLGSQMLIGFHHNTPDNTLPIIWMDPANGAPRPWTPVFKRYPKI